MTRLFTRLRKVGLIFDKNSICANSQTISPTHSLYFFHLVIKLGGIVRLIETRGMAAQEYLGTVVDKRDTDLDSAVAGYCWAVVGVGK